MTEEDLVALAQRGQIAPESLTAEEIRALALAVMCDLNDSGEGLQPEMPNSN